MQVSGHSDTGVMPRSEEKHTWRAGTRGSRCELAAHKNDDVCASKTGARGTMPSMHSTCESRSLLVMVSCAAYKNQ
jgi:hypothetical protein